MDRSPEDTRTARIVAARQRIESNGAKLLSDATLVERLDVVHELLSDIQDYVEDFPEMPVGDSLTLAVLIFECEVVIATVETLIKSYRDTLDTLRS